MSIIKILSLICVLTFLGCDRDDPLSVTNEDIQTNAKIEDLIGTWTISYVEFEGEKVEVPANIEECGNDFFIYHENKTYEEFVFQNSETCKALVNNLKWELEEGILTLLNPLNEEEFEIFTINSLSSSKLIFTLKIDLINDNQKESYKVICHRYLPPVEMDIYSNSFSQKYGDEFKNHIEFSWDAYSGYNTFDRYEILRSESSYNIHDAVVIKTNTSVEATSFIEESPIESGTAYYFLKIYTDKGLLGQSVAKYVDTQFLRPKMLAYINANSTENEVKLNWEKYTGLYFSHYELSVQDQNDNSSPKIEHKTTIHDINTTSFTDISPPYVNNPVYSIKVYNLFGNESLFDRNIHNVKTNFTRAEILGYEEIKYICFDVDNQSFYFYGTNRNKDGSSSTRIIKYNYITKQITAEAFKLPTTYNEVEMKLIDSEYGKELFFNQGGDLWVYNADDLTYKYSLLDDHFGHVDSFGYLGNNIWILSDNDDIFTYSRNNNTLTKIDEKPHFSDHQGGMKYELSILDDSNFLLSHNNEGRAIHYSIDNSGVLTNNGIKEIPLLADVNSDISVNYKSSLLLNKKRNTVYATSNFSLVDKIISPKVCFSFNYNGTKIFGTNNEPSNVNFDENFKRELVIYDLQTKDITKKETKGYPFFIFEDKTGKIISLSSGYPRDSYYNNRSGNEPDFFIEIIE